MKRLWMRISEEVVTHHPVADPDPSFVPQEGPAASKRLCPLPRATSLREDELWLRALKSNDLCKCGAFIIKRKKISRLANIPGRLNGM